MGTWTRTEAPGEGMWPLSSMRARTVALRVDGSTRESIATTAALIGCVAGGGIHGDRDAAAQGGSHLLRDREIDVRRVVDALQGGKQRAFVEVLARVHVRNADSGTEWGANGLAANDRARARDLCLRDVAMRAGAVELHLGGRMPLDHALHARELCLGEVLSAPTSACNSASSTETSSATKIVPASTIWPGVRRVWRTVPANSLRTVIERSAITVPMEVVVRLCSRSRAIATATVSAGSGWLAAAVLVSSIDTCFQAASATPTVRTPTMRIADAEILNLLIRLSDSTAG